LQADNPGVLNTAVGGGALTKNTSGSGNAAFGVIALGANTTGSYNIAIGSLAGSSLTTGSNNIDIGNAGINGDSGVIRIGTQGNQTSTYLVGTVTVSGNVGIGTTNPSQALEVNGTIQVDGGVTATGNFQTTGNVEAVNADFSGYMFCQGTVTGHEIHSTSFMTSDTDIYAVGTVYAHAVSLTSDRNAKENFKPVDNQAVLAKVAALPMTQWNYKTDKADVQHIGPMAQDFRAAFGLDGADDKRISVVDEGGVALAAIQGLDQKLKEKDGEIQELKQRLEKLEQLMNGMKGGAQ
jgi:hypothetical protein